MVFVNGRFLGRPITGVERYAREITRRLGVRVEILTPPPALAGPLGHLWEQTALPRHVDGEVLWSPANSGPLTVSRQVVTIHDAAPVDHPEWFAPAFAAWYRFLLPRLARRACRVVTVSAFSRARLAAATGLREADIVVVPGAADERFRPAPAAAVTAVRAKYGLTGPYLFTLASRDPRKNLAGLIRAWEASRLAQQGIQLAIAGRRWVSFPRLPGIDAPGVHTLGAVPDADLPGLYTGALAFVWPSLYEGFGLPLVEAMACGTPVVAARRGAIPEVVGDAALLVDPPDGAALAVALAAIVDDAQLRSRLAAAGQRRATAFSWDRSAERVWELLQEVARA